MNKIKMEPWKEELYHHGILGMKWGVRNGPPYPLAPNKHSASERKAGWRKSLNNKSSETPQALAGGGGGGINLDDEEVLNGVAALLQEEIEKQAARLGWAPVLFANRVLTPSEFKVTLGEFIGLDPDKYSADDIERLRRKTLSRYTVVDYNENTNKSGYTKTRENRPRSRQHNVTGAAKSNAFEKRGTGIEGVFAAVEKELEQEREKERNKKMSEKEQIYGNK